jgi:hypothetical protein
MRDPGNLRPTRLVVTWNATRHRRPGARSVRRGPDGQECVQESAVVLHACFERIHAEKTGQLDGGFVGG